MNLARITFLLINLCPFTLFAQELHQLPLFDILLLEYQGAFRLPADDNGTSSLHYCEGPIAYNPDSNSIFIVGHPHQQAVAEFTIPTLVMGSDLSALNMAGNPIQQFVNVLDNSDLSNPEGLNRIGGMYYHPTPSGPVLIINSYEYYDAPADNLLSTFILTDASNLDSCDAIGIFGLDNQAAHISGWISAIPDPFVSLLGASHLFGHSSGIPIIGRTSVGPSAYSTDLTLMTSPNYSIQLKEKLLGFSLTNPLDTALSNNYLTNDIWTHLTRAVYGFIVPGTRTYFTIGYSGGHNSSVCYKCRGCGGYCAVDPNDYYEYFWLWDMKDLMDVKNGLKQPYEIVPYDYGEFSTIYGDRSRTISGGTFDPVEQNLYLTVASADTLQGTYSFPPVIEVYNIPESLSTQLYAEETGIEIFPNPSNGYFIIHGALDEFDLQVFDINGNVFIDKSLSGKQEIIDISQLSASILLVKILNRNNQKLLVQKMINSTP